MLAGRESRQTTVQVGTRSPSIGVTKAGAGFSMGSHSPAKFDPNYYARMERKLSKKSYKQYADTMKNAINQSIAKNILPNWRAHNSLRGWYSMNYPSIRQNPLLQKRPKPLHYENIKFSNLERPMSAPQRPIIQPLSSASEISKPVPQPSKLSLLASSASRSETFYVQNRVVKSGGGLSGNLSQPGILQSTAGSGFHTLQSVRSSSQFHKFSTATMTTTPYMQKAEIIQKMNEQSLGYSTIHPLHAVLGEKHQNFNRRKVKQLNDIIFDIPKESEEHKHHKWMNKEIITEDSIRTILSPAIEKISLQNHTWIRDCYIDKIGRLAPNLQVLNLRGTNCTDDSISAIFEYTHSITELDVSRCSGLSEVSIIAIADNSPRLTIFNTAHNANAVTDNALTHLQPLPFLSVLNISYCKKVTDEGLKALSQAEFEEMNEIDLSVNPPIPNVSSVQPSLRQLYMNGLTGVTNEGLMKLIRDQHCQIESLEMAYMSQEEVTDEVCKEIAHCQHLLRLDLSGCVNMKDQGLCFLSKGLGKQIRVCGLPRLIVLKLNGLIEIGDTPVAHLADIFINVQVLELARCQKLTEFSIQKVLKCMPKLKLIDLNMIPEVKQEFLDEYRVQNPKSNVIIKRQERVQIARFTVQTVNPKDTGLRVPLPPKKEKKKGKKSKKGKKKKK